jgi:hypothetical protein
LTHLADFAAEKARSFSSKVKGAIQQNVPSPGEVLLRVSMVKAGKKFLNTGCSFVRNKKQDVFTGSSKDNSVKFIRQQTK